MMNRTFSIFAVAASLMSAQTSFANQEVAQKNAAIKPIKMSEAMENEIGSAWIDSQRNRTAAPDLTRRQEDMLLIEVKMELESKRLTDVVYRAEALVEKLETTNVIKPSEAVSAMKFQIYFLKVMNKDKTKTGQLGKLQTRLTEAAQNAAQTTPRVSISLTGQSTANRAPAIFSVRDSVKQAQLNDGMGEANEPYCGISSEAQREAVRPGK